MRANLKWSLTCVLGAFFLAQGSRADDTPAPAPDPEFAIFLQQNHYGVVSTNLESTGVPDFDAEVNGHLAKATFDSGLRDTFITSNCARLAHVAVQATDSHYTDAVRDFMGNGYGLEQPCGIANSPSITVGGWTLNRYAKIRVLPPSNGSGKFVFLGYDYLRLNSIVLPIGGPAFFIRPGLLSAPPRLDRFFKERGFTAIPIKVSDNRALVTGTLNGRAYCAQIATGAQNSSFDGNMLKSMGVYMKGHVGQVDSHGDDPIDITDFMPSEMSVGNLHVDNQRFLAVMRSLSSDPIQAIFGFKFLLKHHAVIDAGSNILWMKGS